MKTIVLAAGTGSRLGKITSARTKGMVPVDGEKLIDYLLEFIDIKLMDEIIVVGGFCHEDLKDHLYKKEIDKIKVIKNNEYLKGNIFTLTAALAEFENDSFLITNVDHIYPPVMFKKMKKHFSAITAMCDFDRKLGSDDMKIKLTEQKNKILEISKQLIDFDCGYIGMTYVDKSMNDIYRKAVKKVIELNGDKAVVENVLHYLAQNKTYSPQICDLSNFGWYEIDTPEELLSAEKRIVTDKNFK